MRQCSVYHRVEDEWVNAAFLSIFPLWICKRMRRVVLRGNKSKGMAKYKQWSELGRK